MAVAVAQIRVLVVDDNDFMRDLVAAMLRDIGFVEIFQASDGRDALEKLATAAPGLIICDIAMKPMDGLMFVEALRTQVWPGAADIPVIFLTSHTEAPMVKQAARLGVQAYLIKPLQKKQLEDRVTSVLERALVRR